MMSGRILSEAPPYQTIILGLLLCIKRIQKLQNSRFMAIKNWYLDTLMGQANNHLRVRVIVYVYKKVQTLIFPQPVYMIPTIRGSSVLQEHNHEEETLALDIIGLDHFFILCCLPLIFENLRFTTSHTRYVLVLFQAEQPQLINRMRINGNFALSSS